MADCNVMIEDTDSESRPSKSRRKREMHELQALGERLVELSCARLDEVEMPEALRSAVIEARGISARGGRRRQLQYIGRLMRGLDPEPIREALARLDGTHEEERALQHAAERWRGRLLAEGDTALAELFARCPEADRQCLRQLVRSAQQEVAAGGAPRRQRELFRALRALLDSGSPGRTSAPSGRLSG